jgi:peptide/nickel transport system permease protein
MSAAPASPTQAAADLGPSEFRRALRRFSRNTPAMVSLAFIIVIIVAAVLAPWISPYPNDIGSAVNFRTRLNAPSLTFLLGTDEAGRDVLTRIMAGAQFSLLLGIVVIAASLLIGVPIGICAGYYGGWTARILMGLTDIFSSIPALVLALAIAVILGPSMGNVILSLSLIWWRVFARIAYGQTLSIKQEDFVSAAKAMGASDLHVMFREIMPNMTSTLVVKAALDAGAVILVGTGISFLGAGASPPTAEWGLIVASGRHYLPDAWWASFFPGVAIFLTVMSLNLIGDGLRDFFGEG